MEAIIQVVEKGGYIKTTSRFYGILPGTLANHVTRSSKERKWGPPLVPSIEEETALETYMIEMVDYSHPMSMDQLGLKVVLLIYKRPTPFTGWHSWKWMNLLVLEKAP